MFTSFAQLIALHLEAERDSEATEAALLDERAAGELREQFIAVLGHDLRNPLASMSACGLLLDRQADDPAKVRTIARRIDENARRMSALMDDTLDLARARLGGGIGMRPAPVDDLDRALQAVVAELRDAHPKRVIEARIEVATRVVCDRGRVQQLVSNLLGNALVHGSAAGPVSLDGEPSPTARWRSRSPTTASRSRPDSLSKVFAPFWRSSTSATREGLGLGLYICAQIVEGAPRHTRGPLDPRRAAPASPRACRCRQLAGGG